MRYFADNADYRKAIMESKEDQNVIGNPITYRMLHEHAAGMGLEDIFFAISGIDPDSQVTCNCKFDNGHEPNCDLVAANELLREEMAKGK